MSLTFAVRGQTVVQDVHGEAVRSAHIEVRAPDGTLAVLYTGRTKAATVANPTTADTFGQLAFYSDQAGVYTLDVTTPAGVFARSVEAEVDAADLALQSDIAATLAAAEAYTDAQLAGKTLKDDVRAATTVNVILTGLQTVDGVSLVVDDRVLVKNQTTASQNGVYLAKLGAWVRTADANTGAELLGAAVLVRAGGQALQLWAVTNDAPIILGTTAVTWGQASGGTPAGVMLLAGDQTATGIKQVDTVRPKKGPWADPIAWGADPTGVADTRSFLLSAQADSGNIRVAPGTYRVASNTTLTGAWRFAKGAILKPDSGVTITFDQSELHAGRYQIFDVSAGGTITWNSTDAKAERIVKPEWWGAVPKARASASEAAATRTALQAAFNTPSGTRDPAVVWLAPGCCYSVDRAVTMAQAATKLIAKGARLAFNTTTWAGAVTDSVLVLGTTTGNSLTAGQQAFSSGWAAEQACTIAQHDNGDGTFSLDLTATDLDEMDAITTAEVAVTGGLGYTVSAVFAPVSLAEDLPDVSVVIVWKDVSGNEIGRSRGQFSDLEPTGTTPATMSALAPSAASLADLELRVTGVTTVGDTVRASVPVLGLTAARTVQQVDLDRLHVLVDGANATTQIMHSLVRVLNATFLRWDYGRLVAGYAAMDCLYIGDVNTVEFNFEELHTSNAIRDGIHHDGSLATASPANGSRIGKGKHQQHGGRSLWWRGAGSLSIEGIDSSLCAGGSIYLENAANVRIATHYNEACGPGDTRPITLLDTLGVPTLKLVSLGSANAPDLSVTVAAGTNPNTFKLQVLRKTTVVETYDNLVMNSASTDYAITRLAKPGRYFTATDLLSVSASPANQPAAIVGAAIDTTQLPNTTKIIELVGCNSVDITGKVNGANGSGAWSTHNYAGLYMTSCHGVRVGGTSFKSSLVYDIYADDSCTDISVDAVTHDPLRIVAVSGLKVRLPASAKETTRTYVSDLGQAAPAKRYDRPGTLINWIPQPSRISAWTNVGSPTIPGTAVAPDGTSVVDVIRLPANTAESTVGKSITTAVIPGTSTTNTVVTLRFWLRLNARVGYAYGEAMIKVTVNRGDNRRLWTGRFTVGDQWHLYELDIDPSKLVVYGFTTTNASPTLPAVDGAYKVTVANAVTVDQLDVETWGFHLAPKGSPSQFDPEATSALSAAAFGPVARGPRVTLFRGQVVREIWTTDSPQTLGMAPPAGDTQWRTGDVAWNATTTAGITGPLGWRCTVAGSPGTWSAFGTPPGTAEPWQTIATSGSAPSLDLSSYVGFDLTLTAATVSPVFASPPTVSSFSVLGRQDGTGGRAVAWPASVKWDSGAAPVLPTAANADFLVSFLTLNGGTSWRGVFSGKNFA